MKKLSIQNIVVPIDFSERSIQAIETARRLAQRFSATIHLVHVHQFRYPDTFMGPVVSAAELPDSFEEHRSTRLAEQLKAIAIKSELSPRDQTHLRMGAAAFDGICRVAKEIPADLIVMPTHGYTGLKHVFLGSTAERVVQHSPCPVFVVRNKKRTSKTRPGLSISAVLVPVDFSDCSREGLEYAIGFASEFGAKIILLHSTYLGYNYPSEGNALYGVPALQEAARENAERRMRKLLRAAKFGQVKFETVLTEASPVLDIGAFAKDHDVDLIITSTHGLTGFKHVLIGSIAEKVVRHAPCSVLVVPSHPRIRAANLVKTRSTKTRGLVSSLRRIRPVADQRQPRKSPRGKTFTKKDRKLAAHAFPERRKTNKFRESHLSR
ncbi:MAG TPA: universal stress protein [Candidatus Udaeobacter sp.]|nr:universal stress protein [Candidatus Udaeobacter sp.]